MGSSGTPKMGLRESTALSSTAELLELAVAGGDLVPVSRGSKQRQNDLVRAHFTTARIELAGRTLLHAVRSSAEMPDGVDHPIPPLRWLSGELAEGQSLTHAGNLRRAFVHDATERIG